MSEEELEEGGPDEALQARLNEWKAHPVTKNTADWLEKMVNNHTERALACVKNGDASGGAFNAGVREAAKLLLGRMK